MAYTLDCRPCGSIGVPEALDWLEANVDPRDPDGLAQAGEVIAGLATNRTFIRDAILAELRDVGYGTRRAPDAPLPRRVSAQSVLFGARRQFTIRANVWSTPVAGSERIRKRIDTMYSYAIAHDHNFQLLTVGYQGPGYTTTIFEQQSVRRTTIPGAPTNLKFLECAGLTPGKVMFYRPLKDVHIQHYPEEVSISLNVLCEHSSYSQVAQIEYDTDNSTVAGVLVGTQVFRQIGVFKLLAVLGGLDDEIGLMLREIAQSHHSPLVRAASLSTYSTVTESIDNEFVERLAVADESDEVQAVVARCRQVSTQHLINLSKEK